MALLETQHTDEVKALNLAFYPDQCVLYSTKYWLII